MFASAGVEFERVVAVDACATPTKDLRSFCPQVRFYIANARRVVPGEIGCALSHIKAWNAIVARGLPLAAVFEDDVLADMSKLKEHFADIEATNDPSVPTVWLMNRGLPKPKRLCGLWYEMRTADGRWGVDKPWAFGAYCYVLNTAAAKRLAELLTPMANVCDAWSTYARCGVRILAAADAFATTRPGLSAIAHRKSALWHFSLYRHFYWLRYRFAFRADLLMKRLEGKR